ncbi:amino acid adenylation domain-containing protein [Clostridium tagluense]|uniref:non-ribosomal peptide synthetase n=1 Tax=Clostridium tagluense TaxID=360422 RepID=UPI001CF4AF27|nr:non-ribosomal peptide synthetase [Clostridium tagluense]MCB2311577.1 amino acid adenylation domain-containing protein [Clostridium tagluense]MCB2316301.1 amino acid adenylation domain-containing protein [Clostridium tagluense]MCB2321155.1 amino acid adenylation domain-containing protein [Clostridium tagluense]MCB2326170.1 amino acid adenylation domain-containing protein [Clostridium tagluense]MCB2330893.1 amino acid adenylation domain-containing protein [Clostridium tagluense]
MQEIFSKPILFEDERLTKEKNYWSNKLKGRLTKSNFPYDYINKDRVCMETLDFILTDTLSGKLIKSCNKSDKNLYMLLFSGVILTLYKYTNNEEIILGTPIYKQEKEGEFLNKLLILKNNIASDSSFKEILLNVKKEIYESIANQNYPIRLFLEHSDIVLEDNISTIIQNIVILENIQSERYIQNVNTNIIFCFNRNDSNIECSIKYNSNLYKKDLINRIYEHLISIFNVVLNNPNILIRDIDIVSKNEKHKILNQFNSEYIDYPREKLLNELFEEQVENTPNNIALIYKNKRMSYKELNEKSNQLAKLLIEKGVKSDTIVGIITERSMEMIIGIMAILKAGGAYMPIDPMYPQSRMDYILKDSHTNIILTQEKFKKKLNFNGNNIIIDDISLYIGDVENIKNHAKSSNLAYIIYTSGTTGEPKSILTEHRNVISYITTFNNLFRLSYKDRTLQQTSFTFDGFVEETYSILTKGGTVVIPENDQIKDAEELRKLIVENEVTILSCSPLMLKQFNNLEPMKSVHTFLSSSDILKRKYYSNIIKYSNVFNMYGPSETTVCATWYKCNSNNGTNIPIGKPLKNYQIYILDSMQKLLPVGIEGELYISGEGVSRGYLNRKELTEEKFLDNPFLPEKKMYRTGDLGKWLSNGEIELVGRIDYQVKIRGFRVEIEEIENRLLNHDDIKECVVLAKECEDGNKYLSAYLSWKRELTVLQLREYLSKYLPDYMIPSLYIYVDQIPLTSNGKIDRRRLEQIKENVSLGSEYEEPRNDIEKKLVDIWRDTLKVEKIGINDNFFELGGHSLKAVLLTSKVFKELNVEISMVEIFKLPTIKIFAKYITGIKEKENKFKYDNVVLIKKGSDQARNLFLIHDVSGDIGQYVKFCSKLNANLNCWGISAESLENYTPQNITIETIAEKYLQIIKAIQPNGEYNIAGWSLGGVIAFEIVRQLEKNHEKINNLVLFDSYAPKRTLVNRYLSNRYLSNKFTIVTEKKYIKDFVADKQIKEKINKEPNIENIWLSVVKYFEKNNIDTNEIKKLMPTDIRGVIPVYKEINIAELIHHLNISRTLINAEKDYQPINKIKTQIYFFKASESEGLNPEIWNLYCEKAIQYEEVLGTHFTMFEKELIEKFDKLMLVE